MSLPPEVRAKYVAIIDSILAASDLTQISEKSIRKGIQEAVEYDITPQKAAIKALILERFDLFNAKQNGPVPSVETSDLPPTTNGHHKPSPSVSNATPSKREADSEDVSEVIDNAPAKKKRKTGVDNDAAFAAKLQAEEDKLARPTRGIAHRKSATVKKKKTPKKKTASRVKASDDSDLDDSDVAEKKPRNTGFHKPLGLSPALSDLCGGATTLSRPETTKRLWAHIKGNNLQDPDDKRFIICDDKMKAVLKQDKVHMFTMTKLLNKHFINLDE